MKVYCGTKTQDGYDVNIVVDDSSFPLDFCLEVMNHSPDGFAWGYNGSGPAQLALAILVDYLKDKELALALYQDFKRSVISQFSKDIGWTLTPSEIDDYLAVVREQKTTEMQQRAALMTERKNNKKKKEFA